MILDERNEFFDDVALNTGAAGTYNLGDVIDTFIPSPAIGQSSGQNLTRDVGLASDLFLMVRAGSTGIVAAGAGTLAFRLVSDDTATPSTTTSTVHYVSPNTVTSAGTIAAGTLLAIVKMPPGQYERYIGVQQVTGTSAITAGTVNAFLTNDPNLFRAYADNVG